jgi:uncharacterized membrane protein YjfL (UPF0719 family)
MPLDMTALAAWIVVTIAFIAVAAFLYTRVTKRKEAD